MPAPSREAAFLVCNLHKTSTVMPKRKASDNTSRAQKRPKPIVLTVLELRSLLNPYNDEDSADVIFEDQKNHATLQRLYESLCRRFTVRNRPDGLRAKVIDNIKTSNLEIAISISSQFSTWEQGPYQFWWPEPPQSIAPKYPHGSYRQRFFKAAIEQRRQLQVRRVLGRFTSIAMYLAFQRFMGCDVTQETVASCKCIITAGKRRIAFCDELARHGDATPQPRRSHHTTAANEESQNGETEESEDDWYREPSGKYYKRTLGIYFLDIIPDSICDEGKSLRKRDLDASVEALRSIKALDWLAKSKTERLANLLLDYQHELLWTTQGTTSADKGAANPAGMGNRQLHQHGNVSAPERRPNCVASTTSTMAQPSVSGMMSLLTAARITETLEDDTSSPSWGPGTQTYSMPSDTGFLERPFDRRDSVGTNARPAEGTSDYYMDLNQIDWFSRSSNVAGDTIDYPMQPVSFDVNATCQMSSLESQDANYHVDAGSVNWFLGGRLPEVIEQ
ncbi:uncharacterized protein BBA_09061 [Beauveria bassiana ARSEF 2860]|uniref:Uncharacterized protein n=1 Tax=Beauveria bassiana (strain ARSEF 2860) TaxID=655819 RepID=J5J641_BEAB2|nr:uncharacterized protein BBA_09061 [Beauveria bassiana ARSEF 2860]EJP62013.1 hypothetical protein BBA_09061 [Beauveria bassiana ARSEF 2860]